MIIKFKIFEEREKHNKPKFEYGEYVVRKYDKKQDVCSIIKLDGSNNDGYGYITYFYEMKNEINDYIISLMKEDFLRKATDEEIEKINIKKASNKYNL